MEDSNETSAALLRGLEYARHRRAHDDRKRLEHAGAATPSKDPATPSALDLVFRAHGARVLGGLALLRSAEVSKPRHVARTVARDYVAAARSGSKDSASARWAAGSPAASPIRAPPPTGDPSPPKESKEWAETLADLDRQTLQSLHPIQQQALERVEATRLAARQETWLRIAFGATDTAPSSVRRQEKPPKLVAPSQLAPLHQEQQQTRKQRKSRTASIVASLRRPSQFTAASRLPSRHDVSEAVMQAKDELGATKVRQLAPEDAAAIHAASSRRSPFGAVPSNIDSPFVDDVRRATGAVAAAAAVARCNVRLLQALPGVETATGSAVTLHASGAVDPAVGDSPVAALRWALLSYEARPHEYFVALATAPYPRLDPATGIVLLPPTLDAPGATVAVPLPLAVNPGDELLPDAAGEQQLRAAREESRERASLEEEQSQGLALMARALKGTAEGRAAADAAADVLAARNAGIVRRRWRAQWRAALCAKRCERHRCRAAFHCWAAPFRADDDAGDDATGAALPVAAWALERARAALPGVSAALRSLFEAIALEAADPFADSTPSRREAPLPQVILAGHGAAGTVAAALAALLLPETTAAVHCFAAPPCFGAPTDVVAAAGLNVLYYSHTMDPVLESWRGAPDASLFALTEARTEYTTCAVSQLLEEHRPLPRSSRHAWAAHALASLIPGGAPLPLGDPALGFAAASWRGALAPAAVNALRAAFTLRAPQGVLPATTAAGMLAVEGHPVVVAAAVLRAFPTGKGGLTAVEFVDWATAEYARDTEVVRQLLSSQGLELDPAGTSFTAVARARCLPSSALDPAAAPLMEAGAMAPEFAAAVEHMFGYYATPTPPSPLDPRTVSVQCATAFCVEGLLTAAKWERATAVPLRPWLLAAWAAVEAEHCASRHWQLMTYAGDITVGGFAVLWRLLVVDLGEHVARCLLWELGYRRGRLQHDMAHGALDYAHKQGRGCCRCSRYTGALESVRTAEEGRLRTWVQGYLDGEQRRKIAAVRRNSHARAATFATAPHHRVSITPQPDQLADSAAARRASRKYAGIPLPPVQGAPPPEDPNLTAPPRLHGPPQPTQHQAQDQAQHTPIRGPAQLRRRPAPDAAARGVDLGERCGQQRRVYGGAPIRVPIRVRSQQGQQQRRLAGE